MSHENGKMHTTPQPAAKSTNATTKLPTATIKRELTTANGAGLPKLSSLAPARDLTLGGRSASSCSKKVFLPNLNVTRNKNANVKTSKDTTISRGRGGRGKSDRGSRGGGRGGNQSSLVQTTGVFSEGAGAVQLRKSGSYSRSTAAEEAGTSAMRKPMLLKSEESKRIDLKAEAAHVREVLGDDSDEDDFKDDKTDLEHIPIKLCEAKWKFIKTEHIKMEVDIKTEGDEVVNGDYDSPNVSIANKIQKLHVKHQDKELLQQQTKSSLARYPQSVEQLLQCTESQIILMQLPDTLPCEDELGDAFEKADVKHSTSININTSAPATSSKLPNQVKGNCLKEMEEGQVGKLIRYQSGKVKLQLGESFFDLEMGMETGFLQDLMSISTNREERSGNMINLGPIQAKVTATPDWEHLLKQQLIAAPLPANNIDLSNQS